MTLAKSNYLLDFDFLNKLFTEKEREQYAKVIALDIDENPVEEIQGRITQGSVPVDGNSAVRRTCSLTLSSYNLDIHNYLWGLETKVKLLIGLKNKINSKYPDICWFKMGTFVLTSFSSSFSTSGYTVTLQGKDKMCLLNGDVGGSLTALSYDFGNVSVINKLGHEVDVKLPLKKIITKAVHDFAKEPYHNIIINDLDDCGLELLEYRGKDPLYFIYDETTQEVTNMTFNTSQIYYVDKSPLSIKQIEASIAENPDNPQFIFKTLMGDMNLTEEETPTKFYSDAEHRNGPYNIIKVTTGMTCGYRTTELVYAGDLICSVNETISSMLSKIVSMLGNYEFFYNIDGQFVFQRKRTYVNTSWNNMVNNGEEDWVENAAYTSSYTFSFEDGNLITSYQNAPNLANVRNDFSIWGTKTTTNGTAVPIHLRYAIDKKPTYYTAFNDITYTTRSKEEVEQDKKIFNIDIGKAGYVKEKSRFGLSEDWWEVRDWAEAWKFSGLDVPTDNLGTYCPVKAVITSDKSLNGSIVGSNLSQEYSYVPKENLDEWKHYPTYRTDDIVFHEDGTYWTMHGSCTHSYTEWLDYFDPNTTSKYGTKYLNGYAYFYKPIVPDSASSANGGHGLILGSQIIYNLDWRELIYRMALDFNKHSEEDNFLATIREKNPYFYPTGYTGYEQYYVDIEGFWRLLYDPEYTTGYNIINLLANGYREGCRLGLWYYDAPNYAQCDKDDIFSSEVTYYTLSKGEYSPAKGLTEKEYKKNPTKYYLITSTTRKKIPLKVPSFNTSEKYYKKNEKGKYILIEPKITASTYQEQVENLFIQKVQNQYFPCKSYKKFTAGKLYFVKQEDGTYKPDTTLNEEKYISIPENYYERVIEGGIVKFNSCVTVVPYDKDRTYCQKNGEVFKDISITEQAYNEKGLSNDLWYVSRNYYFEPVIMAAIPYDPNMTYYEEGEKEYILDKDSPNLYWNKKVQQSPEALVFWFDFLDSYGELSQYSVSSIGDRPKAVNDKDVKAIYFRETPGVIFVDDLRTIAEKEPGYTYAQLPSYLEPLFDISGQGKSAKDVLDNYLYNYSYCTESITISAIPVYSLEPNTRIFVRDDNSGIYGEYIVSKINFPLDINGTMSINAVKVVDRIY